MSEKSDDSQRNRENRGVRTTRGALLDALRWLEGQPGRRRGSPTNNIVQAELQALAAIEKLIQVSSAAGAGRCSGQLGPARAQASFGHSRLRYYSMGSARLGDK